MIDPKNLRCVINQLERIALDFAKKNSVDMIATLVMNTEETCGFKQHMLESEDDGQFVDIYLYSYGNNGVAFVSPSGKSTTDYSHSKKVPIIHDEP
jgi:uncharacterized protein YfaP (DUF2135 family)